MSVLAIRYQSTGQDSCGNTVLMDAACVRLLASSAGSDLGTEDRMGRTVVEVAAQAGACEVLQFLRTELGVDLNSGLSLHAAARHNSDLSDIHVYTNFFEICEVIEVIVVTDRSFCQPVSKF